MDDELHAVYRFLFPARTPVRTPGHTYPDAMIAWIELFRVGRHLSMRAAMQRRHWPLWMRHRPSPSYSQFKRRVATDAVQQLIQRVGDHFAACCPRTGDKAVDGKPLTVGGFSKDPDATRGHVPGGWARGYRLHAVIDAAGPIESWQITALHAGEATVAREVLRRLDLREATVRADANFDSNALYQQVATQGGRMVTPRRKPHTGLGHGRHHPDRLRAIAELEQTPGGKAAHDRHRVRIEQVFGRLSLLATGLWSLPPSVRRLSRVTRYVRSKITLYHAHLALKYTTTET